MKKQLMLATLAAIFFTLIWTACQKETNTPISSNANPSAVDRGGDDMGGGSSGDGGTVLEQVPSSVIQEIEGFKAQLDEWRKGQNIAENMASDLAVYNIESVWNYYVSESTGMFAEDFHFEDSVSVDNTSNTWSASQIASLFESIKGRLSYHYGTISGTDKGIRVIDLSEPIVSNGQTKVYIYMNAGKTAVNNPNQVQAISTRWSLDLGMPATCMGAANTTIGEVVNSQLGFYLKNNVPNAPGNPIVKPNTLILNPRQVRVNNNQFEPPLPGGLVICDGYTYFDFPSMTSEQDPYEQLGQFKIHFDFNANEHCFGLPKLVSYCIYNKEVGETIRTSCVNTLPGLASHRLIATYVQAAEFEFETQNGKITFYEHPTIFYYGRVLFFILEDEVAKVTPDEV